MNEDLKEFLRLLNHHQVDYLVIGAHALAFHGLPRFTEVLDLWLDRTGENARRLALALAEFGTPFPPGGEEAWLEDRQIVRLGSPPNRIDLLNFAAEIPFEKVWDRRVQAEMEGVPAPMISFHPLEARRGPAEGSEGPRRAGGALKIGKVVR